ncbi:hypothetical protein VE23_05710 [Paenibacillus sp. D9]|uniref:hypothetical protein n=1 Tax=Paenibacillus sp. D9 TaxID=665792 RepID=UPI00061F9D81|nr:hypothetical protein [Paenibacillus sp. D9]KKC46739.1 hypothetical protein VE23_05710 [Paenibacillus sp. D9]
MTYRPVDLQVSVPKVHEAGTQQGYYQSRLTAEARSQEQDTAKRSEKNRSSPTEVETKGNLRTGKDSSGNRAGRDKAARNPAGGKEDGAQAEGVHPFKGKHVDFSL